MNVIVDKSTEEGKGGVKKKKEKKSYTTSGLLYKRQVYMNVCVLVSLFLLQIW